MRATALFVLAAACAPEPSHLAAAVTIAITSDDLATATVDAAAQAYVWVDQDFDVRDPVRGLDVQLELDGRLVPLSEGEPGRLAAERQTGFPDHIQLHGDDETRELDHSVPFSAVAVREEDFLTVTISPPVAEGESVSVLRYVAGDPEVQNEPLPIAGSARVEFPSAYARIVVQRIVSTVEDGDGLRMAGSVRVTREVPVPCWVGESCP